MTWCQNNAGAAVQLDAGLQAVQEWELQNRQSYVA